MSGYCALWSPLYTKFASVQDLLSLPPLIANGRRETTEECEIMASSEESSAFTSRLFSRHLLQVAEGQLILLAEYMYSLPTSNEYAIVVTV